MNWEWQSETGGGTLTWKGLKTKSPPATEFRIIDN